MLTPKLSEVIFFFLVLSATPGPAEPRGPRGPMGPRGTRGPLAPPILGPDEGKIFFLKCSTTYRIVASTNTCYYSENQVFGGVTIQVLCSKRGCY